MKDFLVGMIDLPWWGYIVVALVLTHITIAAVTIYLHRNQAHRGLDLHPVVSHFFRFWLWLTTGQVTKEWVAIHRKHHAKCETEEDPHSPHIEGIRKVLLEGAELYRDESRVQATMDDYGHGTPDDWIERHVYSGRTSFYGVSALVIIQFALFGFAGVAIWAVQMMWIPIMAAGIINGAGHWWGYRNYEPDDGSTNLTNIGLLIGGEELHNNHHAFPGSAKFSSKWWEFDLGWMYIQILSALGLATVRKVAPRPRTIAGKDTIDVDTVKAVVVSRLHIMSQYARSVTLPVLRHAQDQADPAYRRVLQQVRRTLVREESRIDDHSRDRLDHVLQVSETLRVVYEYRRSLQAIWARTYASHEKLIQALQEWCHQAEQTGIQALEDFAQKLRGFALHPQPVVA